jgi:hypothetical protein
MLRMNFREATDLLSLPLEKVAEATGRSYATVLAYRTGDRDAPPVVLKAVGKLMRYQAVILLHASQEMDAGLAEPGPR